MLFTAASLLAVLLGFVFVLELLGAFYQAMLRGQVESFARAPSTRSLLVFVALTIRLWLTRAMVAADRVSHLLHELAHAVFQFAAGGMPRIVMCDGGGYAEARPWPVPGGRLVFHLGMTFWRGWVSMAPLIVASGVLLAALWWASPYDADALFDGADAIAIAVGADPRGLPSILVEVGAGQLNAAVAAPWLPALALFATSLLVLGHATPSSVDFVNARSALPAYAAATLLAVALYEARGVDARALLTGVGGLATLALLWSRVRRGDPRDRLEFVEGLWRFGETLAASLAVLGVLGYLLPTMRVAPATTLVDGIAATVVVATLTATSLLAFVALMVGLSLLSLTIRPVLLGLRALPRALRSVFTTIAICPEERVMFQDACDVCGCSLREFERNGCGRG